jgi:antitoxin (DNA-binding transcriptional repressor) of toxin-antitoxin stability system
MFVMNSNDKGAIAELEIAAAAVKLGLPVFKPLSEHSRADLILEIGGRLMRVQCKWGRLGPNRDVVVVRIGGCRLSPRGYVRSTYTEAEIDVFGVYCGDLDRCFLLPSSRCAGVKTIRLRLTPARNGQQACTTLADDFNFAGAVAQLARAPDWQSGGRGFKSPQLHSNPTAETPSVTVGSDVFRDRLGYWMERVGRGDEILVTYRGRPRLRVTPADAGRPEGNARASPMIDALAAS